MASHLREATRTRRRTGPHRLGHALRRQQRHPRPPARSGWKKGAPRALGRSRGGFGTKVHLRTDSRGNPIAFLITGGEAHDAPQLLRLMDIGRIKRISRGRARLRPAHVAGDKAYDSDSIRDGLRNRGVAPVIPARRNRKRIVKIDQQRYRGRNVIERCFNRLKQWRRVATRYEKHGANYVAVLLIVSTMHFLKLII